MRILLKALWLKLRYPNAVIIAGKHPLFEDVSLVNDPMNNRVLIVLNIDYHIFS